jgi:hypothetical protein
LALTFAPTNAASTTLIAGLTRFCPIACHVALYLFWLRFSSVFEYMVFGCLIFGCLIFGYLILNRLVLDCLILDSLGHWQSQRRLEKHPFQLHQCNNTVMKTVLFTPSKATALQRRCGPFAKNRIVRV